MSEKIIHHFSRTLRVIRSCNTEEQILAAGRMVSNFINYWNHQKLNPKSVLSYVTCLNLVLKHKQKDISNYE